MLTTQQRVLDFSGNRSHASKVGIPLREALDTQQREKDPQEAILSRQKSR